MSKKIGIVGLGYVGSAFKKMVESHYEVIEYDPPKLGDKSATKEEINVCDLAVVCVFTPTNPDGSCDTSIVEETVDWLETPVILIKSTIAPGTVDKLREKYQEDVKDVVSKEYVAGVSYKRIVFSPEYVGEGKYYVTPRMDFQTDMKKTPFVILGGYETDCDYILDLLVPVLGPEKRYYKCSALEAEIIKYMENTYFGVKITFANEMYGICQAFGADWYKVWQGWSLDPRVDVMHTAVFPDARGFGGKCLPKDLNALVAASLKVGYRPEFLIEMLKSNARFRPDEPVRFKEVNGEE